MPITLVPFAAEHAQALAGLVHPEEAAQVLAQPNIQRYRAVFAGGICVGVVGLKLVGEFPEIVVATANGHRQQGYATAAVREMFRYAFEDVGVLAVYAKCLVGRPSNKVAEKAGFDFVVQQGQERFYELKKANWEATQMAAQ